MKDNLLPGSQAVSRLIGDPPKRRGKNKIVKNHMWYVYVIESQKNHFKYIGYTKDLKTRFKQHNSVKAKNLYTYKNRPFKLIYYEAYLNKLDATQAEKFYKTGYGREILNGKLNNYLKQPE